MEASFSTSERGKELLVLNKFKFYLAHVSKKNVHTWRCIRKTCRVAVHTEDKSLNFVNFEKYAEESHKHTADPENKLNRQEISNKLKRKIQEDMSERPIKLIRKELREYDEEGHLNLVDIGLIRRNMYNAKRQCYPALPKSISDAQDNLEKMDPKTNRGEDFLFLNDRKTHIVMFSCQENIEYLKKIETIYMDGTFTYCTKFFYQMYTVHGLLNDVYTPLVYCLLPNKSKDAYVTILEKLRDVEIAPKEIYVDFEISMHKASISEFSNQRMRIPFRTSVVSTNPKIGPCNFVCRR